MSAVTGQFAETTRLYKSARGSQACRQALRQHHTDAPASAHASLQHDYGLLTSIPAGGPQLCMNMSNVLRSYDFESASQVVAFMRMFPFEKQSVTSGRGKTKMPKIGSLQLRAKLYMAALCARGGNK
ncbi:transposase [Pantoea agglomerans]|uniref:transposase n=1 Tax=Enterobacter agglomerans TaxID=549 RepID=UPI003AB0703C